jgi:Asp-tRNA(Asn)/Glu-tRNA(Gln) amidotransferase A subunit family amidase
MMTKLAEATAEVDVYIVPANVSAPAIRRLDSALSPPGPEQARRTALQRHFDMANIAGYPAISAPNGFSDAGTPTAITFYARPFGETELLSLTKAWQDASGFHLKHPALDLPHPETSSGA